MLGPALGVLLERLDDDTREPPAGKRNQHALTGTKGGGLAVRNPVAE